MSTAVFSSFVNDRISAVEPVSLTAVLSRSRRLKALTVAADVASMAVAVTAAFILRHAMPGGTIAAQPEKAMQYLVIGFLALPVMVGCFSRYRLYSGRQVSGRLDESRRLIHANLATTLGMAVLGYALRYDVARGWLVLSFGIGLVLTFTEREIVRRAFQFHRRRGRLLRPVLVVGANLEGLAISTDLTDDPTLGYRVVGFTDDDHPQGHEILDQQFVLGGVNETLDAVRRTGASGVIIATTSLDLSTSNRLVRQLVDAGVHVELSSSLQDIAAERVNVRALGRHPVAYVEPVRRNGWRAFAKQAFDMVAAGSGLVVTFPLLLATAILIKIDSRGPIFFKQERLGQNGVPFKVIKFRTMVTNAEHLILDLRSENQADGPLFKMKNDPRVTRVGRILRKLSIDELPQLWNVCRREMSLVGPRPALASEVHGWSPELHNRLRVKPGLTGMWQVSPQRHLSFDYYVRLDLYYVDNWSLCTDLAIIAKTLPSVLMRRGDG
ncbi:MAG: hypothetical protein QOG64_3248 [Acidimicrobiaceae bacterium]|nr:hypothetical protein [Acidimicrobiaceae bacterium]